MEILVTGATGFLGKTLVSELKNNSTVFSLSRSFGDYKVSLDSTIPDFKRRFNLVVHAAGKAHSIPRTEEDKKQFFLTNVGGTKNLLKGLESGGVPEQFVFVSSVSVYGQESGTGIDEKHKLNAKDAYGLSKIEAETIVSEWCEKHNVVCTILRLPLLVWKNPPGNLESMLKAIDKGYYFNIGGGKARKSMVLNKDVAVFIPKVAEVGGIFNLTDGIHPSFLELSFAISEQKKAKKPLNLPMWLAKLVGLFGDLLGNKAPLNSHKVKKITCDLTFDDSKAREKLGWKPKEVLEYLRNNNLLFEQ